MRFGELSIDEISRLLSSFLSLCVSLKHTKSQSSTHICFFFYVGSLRKIRREHEDAMSNFASKSKTNLEEMEKKYNAEAHTSKYLQTECENEKMLASKLQASENAWMEIARSTEETQMHILDESRQSLRQSF